MIETEVKFLVRNFETIRQRLLEAGAVSLGNVFETNFRYDDAGHHLLSNRCLLRLRQDRRSRLTFKRPHPEGGRQFKTHEELEIEVSDFDTTHRILAALGYHRAQVYEKQRETFEMGATEICLDHMPYGHFIEIEGTAEAIPLVAERLGLEWHRRILANYLQIFDSIRNRLGLSFTDVTFDNFQTVPANPEPTIRGFEMGSP